MRHPIDYAAYALVALAAWHLTFTAILTVWRALELGDHLTDMAEAWIGAWFDAR